MNDEKIIELIINRNELAISALTEKYGKRLTQIAKSITHDDFMSNECVNDTYLTAWNSIPSNRPDDHLYPFLACTVKHIAMNRAKSERTMKRGGNYIDISDKFNGNIPAMHEDINALIDNIWLRQSINDFLKSLNNGQRDIFIRRYMLSEKISDIANDYYCSESRIKSLMLRLRKKLRNHLKTNETFYVK